MMKKSVYYNNALCVLLVFIMVCCSSFSAFAVGSGTLNDGSDASGDACTAEYASASDVICEQPEEQQTAGPETSYTDALPYTSDTDVLAEKSVPSWSVDIPDNPPVAYGAKVVNISAATAVDIEDLGDNVIYLTVTSDCVFEGMTDEMPVKLCVDCVPVNPGEAVVYGKVTSEGEEYAPVTLVFSENGWDAIASGSYSLTISYDSYLG